MVVIGYNLKSILHIDLNFYIENKKIIFLFNLKQYNQTDIDYIVSRLNLLYPTLNANINSKIKDSYNLYQYNSGYYKTSREYTISYEIENINPFNKLKKYYIYNNNKIDRKIIINEFELYSNFKNCNYIESIFSNYKIISSNGNRINRNIIVFLKILND